MVRRDTVEQYYQMAQKITSANQKRSGTIRHNLASSLDYDYVTWRLGGEGLLKKSIIRSTRCCRKRAARI